MSTKSVNTSACWLECPVCEYRFSVPPEFGDQSGKCPKCEQVFDASECHFEEKSHGPRPAELEIPVPHVIESIEKNPETAGSPPPPPELGEEPAFFNAKNETVDPEMDFNQPFVPASKKKTDPNKILLYVAGSCVLAIGLLIGIPLIAKAFIVKSEEQPDDEVLVEAYQSNDPEENGDAGGGSTGAKKRKSRRPAKADRTIKKLTDAELDDIWTRVHSAVVWVNAKIPKGDAIGSTVNSVCHGVVISQDGLIAVPLDRIAGANSISIRFARQNVDGKDRWQKPIDATTLVSRDPSLNIGVIRVPNSTVPAKPQDADVAFNDRGIVPVLNNKSLNEFLRQTKLRPPKRFSELSEGEKQALRDSGFSLAADVNLVLHTARINKSGVGVPLFDEDGCFVGMHIGQHAGTKNSYALSWDALLSAAAKSLPEPISLTRAKAADSVDVPESTSQNASAVQSKSFQESLDRMTKATWKVTDEKSYDRMQDFVQWLAKAQAEYETADFSRRLELEKTFEEFKDQKKQHLFWATGEQGQKVNQIALKSLRTEEKGWFAYVRVVKPAGLSVKVDGQSALVAEVVQTGKNVLLLPGEVEGPFLPATEWMVFGENRDDRRIRTTEFGICYVVHLVGVHRR